MKQNIFCRGFDKQQQEQQQQQQQKKGNQQKKIGCFSNDPFCPYGNDTRNVCVNKLSARSIFFIFFALSLSKTCF